MAPVFVGEPLEDAPEDSTFEASGATSLVVSAVVSDLVLGSAASETPSAVSVVGCVEKTLTVLVSFIVAVVVPSMVAPSVVFGVI